MKVLFVCGVNILEQNSNFYVNEVEQERSMCIVYQQLLVLFLAMLISSVQSVIHLLMDYVSALLNGNQAARITLLGKEVVGLDEEWTDGEGIQCSKEHLLGLISVCMVMCSKISETDIIERR